MRAGQSGTTRLLAVPGVVMAVAALTALAVLGLGGVAGAQEAGATLAVQQVHPAEGSVHYILQLTSADGEGVSGATVTATPTSPDGTASAPVTFTDDGDGFYEGAVEMATDGTWIIAFTSTDPAASLSYQQPIPATESSSGDAGGSDEDPSPVLPLVIAGVFALLLAALGVWTLLDRRRSAAEEAEEIREAEEARAEGAGTDPAHESVND